MSLWNLEKQTSMVLSNLDYVPRSALLRLQACQVCVQIFESWHEGTTAFASVSFAREKATGHEMGHEMARDFSAPFSNQRGEGAR